MCFSSFSTIVFVRVIVTDVIIKTDIWCPASDPLIWKTSWLHVILEIDIIRHCLIFKFIICLRAKKNFSVQIFSLSFVVLKNFYLVFALEVYAFRKKKFKKKEVFLSHKKCLETYIISYNKHCARLLWGVLSFLLNCYLIYKSRKNIFYYDFCWI
jgi:hypothetical protein